MLDEARCDTIVLKKVSTLRLFGIRLWRKTITSSLPSVIEELSTQCNTNTVGFKVKN